MTSRVADSRPPGCGAERPSGRGSERPPGRRVPRRYVYIARSRRAGGLSLGIDLTPQGFCTFGCIYCQASHPSVENPDLHVDVDALRAELHSTLMSPTVYEMRDLVLAGAGEPTTATNFSQVIDTVIAVCGETGFHRPRRVFTNGRQLPDPAVLDALVRWIASGGEVWVKLDGSTDSTISRMSGRLIDAARHLEGIWRLAENRPIGVQTMVVYGPNVPTPEHVVEEVIDALKRALTRGAKIHAVHLLTISRLPADPSQASVLQAVSDDDLKVLAERIRTATGLSVASFGSQQPP